MSVSNVGQLNLFYKTYKPPSLSALSVVRIPRSYLLSKILLIISTYFYYIQFASNNTRASSACKLKCIYCILLLTIHFFYFNHVVRIWNSLPIINLSSSSSTIKKLIKTFLSWQHFLSTFNPHNTCSWFLCCSCHLCLNNSS